MNKTQARRVGPSNVIKSGCLDRNSIRNGRLLRGWELKVAVDLRRLFVTADNSWHEKKLVLACDVNQE